MGVMVYQDSKNNWHLIRSLAQEGLGITARGYCEHKQKGGRVEQLPDKFMKHLCKECQNEFEETVGKA